MKPGWGEAQRGFEELGEGVAQRMSDEPGVPIGEERRSERADAAAWVRGR